MPRSNPARRQKILVIGSAGADMTIHLEHIPRAGETLIGTEFTTCAGGKGANQAVAAARAGGDVTFVARLGNDAFGDDALVAWREDGIDIQYVQRDETSPTGVALIFVDRAGENSIGVAPGANGKLTPADVGEAISSLEGVTALILQLEIPLATVQAAVDLAHERSIPIILNPAPALDLPDALLRKIAIATPNETEAERLTGVPVATPADAAKAARVLRQRGVETVILTMGAQGAHVASPDGAQMIPGVKVNPIDTVAAGDVFNGALAVALGEGRPLLAAVRFAHTAAAIAVTRPGAQPSAPYRAEIDSLEQA